MNEKPTLGVIAVAKYNHQKDEVKEMLVNYKKRFTGEPSSSFMMKDTVLFDENDVVETAKQMERDGADALLLIVGTWIFSSHVISAVNDLNIPFILYGLSDKIANGNFGASIQIRYVLQEMGKKFLYLYGQAQDENNIQKILKFTRSAWTKNSIRNAKIATIGGKCMMMYQTQVNEFSWKSTFGVDFPQYDTVQVFTEMKNVSESEAREVADDFVSKFDRVVWEIGETGEKIAKDAILSQAKMYLAFKRLAKLYNITVFANKCMPEMASQIYGYKYAGCMATCMLNEAGLFTACEADLPAALTMLLLNRLTGKKVFFADIARLSADKNRITFFNCGTGPVSMADRTRPVELWPTPSATADEGVANEYMTDGADKERGACVRFDLPNDREATIMRIGGNDGTLRFHVATAATCSREVEKDEVLGQRWPGFGLKFKGNIDEFIQNTVGHHYVLVEGNYVQELEYLAQMYGIGFTFFDGNK
jgi:L-fucose isomerase-like protein